MFTGMMNMGVLLECISPLNVYYIHFYCAHKCKGVNLKYVLFNILRWHRNCRPILGSVSHWKPVDALEGN